MTTKTKLVGISVIVAALFLGMTMANSVRAYDPSHGDCGQRGYSWEYCGYTQPPTINTISWGSADGNLNNPSCEHHCYSGGSSGGYDDNNNAFTQHPTIQQVSFRTDNCFWSYPVQCQPS